MEQSDLAFCLSFEQMEANVVVMLHVWIDANEAFAKLRHFHGLMMNFTNLFVIIQGNLDAYKKR